MKKIKVPLYIKNIFNDETRTRLRNMESTIKWYFSGMKDPPLSNYKRRFIKKISKDHPAQIFIETGTFGGDTVQSMRKRFKKIYSVELDPTMAHTAQKRFSDDPNIVIFHGDSTSVLPILLSKIQEPVVFWLDGHYSGENTAKGERVTPILKELEIIFKKSQRNNLILIDDARLFNGTDEYPTLEDMKKIADFEIKNDIIIMRT